MKSLLLALAVFVSVPAMAEYATYENVELYGLSRENSWLAPDFEHGYTTSMVCDVNGPDGYLAIRSGPSTNRSIKRKLKRLAIVVVDTNRISGDGRWIKVVDAYRTHDTNGFQYDETIELPVNGWASTRYLCDYGS